ncbi:MAG: hypothetical protein ACI86H_000799 [bacterium]|jgi:hypothetical protein
MFLSIYLSYQGVIDKFFIFWIEHDNISNLRVKY